MRRLLAAAAAVVAAGPAGAHSFAAGSGTYDQVVEGVGTVFAYPDSLLPLIALGLLLTLWQSDGLVRAWPAAALGQVLGLAVAPLAGPWIALAAMAGGVVTAILGALAPGAGRAVALGLAAGVSALVTAALLEGHGYVELPVGIYAGLLLGINMVLGLSANLARLILQSLKASWVRIALRTVSSWVAAILVLTLAFLGLGQG